MANTTKTLEQLYQDFCINLNIFCRSSPVEFIGINLNNNINKPYSFKRYYRINRKDIPLSFFIKNLNERKMIHSINCIDDSLYRKVIRFEIALANRVNENMDWLFVTLKDILPDIINKNLNNILQKLSPIKITGDKLYEKAAIFFIGFIMNNEYSSLMDIHAFKLYYLLRHCSSTNDIGSNFIFDNDFFISKLKRSGIKQFIILSDIIKQLIKISGCNLSIAAVDFLRNGTMKYKIYIKDCHTETYITLAELFTSIGEYYLANQIIEYNNWITTHLELKQYGIAVCIDSNSLYTINIYH